MNELALFAGAGGGILGGKLLGWRTVCAVEWEQYPASVLCARQNDGLLPPFPIWDDVQTFDGKPWRGIVDVVSGGFPCQDISAAGKGAGIDGERSGMWGEMARIICEVRPKFVFVENSPMLTSRGLGRVLGDLAAMGFDARWGVLGAKDIGANHQRDRIWIVGKATNSSVNRLQGQADQQIMESQGWNELQLGESRDSSKVAYTSQLFSNGGNNNARISLERETQSEFGNDSWSSSISNPNSPQCQRRELSERTEKEYPYASDSRWWETEPNVGRMVDGMASGVDRLKAIGNGQVPLCAATAWRILTER
jgi:DNA (cytosine-5)-methyltransferase 1